MNVNTRVFGGTIHALQSDQFGLPRGFKIRRPRMTDCEGIATGLAYRDENMKIMPGDTPATTCYLVLPPLLPAGGGHALGGKT